MNSVPHLSEAERKAALEKAKESRQIRSQYKSKVSRGDISLADVFLAADSIPAVAKMRVSELVASIPGYGKVRVTSLLERLHISQSRRIQGLGKHQRLALLKEFEIPSTQERGSLLVLSGPGGVGKSTVAKALRSVDDFWVSVSATTRAPRPNEIEGVDYLFYSQEQFDRAVTDGEFLEWAEFAGNRYGTLKAPVFSALASGRNVLLEIEISGAKQIRAAAPEAVLVFLEPPSWEELVARLEGRGTDSPERRAIRLALAQEELAAASFFDEVVVNTEVQEVAQRLIELASTRRK